MFGENCGMLWIIVELRVDIHGALHQPQILSLCKRTSFLYLYCFFTIDNDSISGGSYCFKFGAD